MASQRVIGRYVLCEAIAAGGAATVHMARLIGPEGFSRTVAIKRLHAQFARSPEFVSMFLDEARLASRIHHPNVVSPQDIVVLDDELLIVMDYVHGESLSRIMKALDGERMPIPIAAAIIGQVLLGLQAAHEATSENGEPLEIVHRDVSPQNILLGEDGVARLVDFGIAKARNKIHQTDSGMVKGKPGYMAPEQVKADSVDRRTDVFAAGIVLWEMLTGRKLFRGATPDASVQNILHMEVSPPSKIVPEVPADLDEVVSMALARDPASRFHNARAMAIAIASVAPPAGTLEVAAWISRICGAALRARAERLSELESLPVEELTHGLPCPSPRSAASESELPGNAGAQGVEAPFATVARPTKDVGRALRPRRRAVLISAALAALIAAALGTTFLARRGETSEPSLRALPFEPAISRDLQSALVVRPSKSVVVADTTVSEPQRAREPENAPKKRVPAPSAMRKESARHAEARARDAVTKTLTAPVSKRSSACDMPFFFDRRGVKRFNPECF